MLHTTKVRLFSKIMMVVCCGMLSALVFDNAFAINSNPSNIVSGWDSNGTANNNTADRIILGGCTSSDWNASCQGTNNDEGAVVVNMAREFNDKGGYFCPTRVQMQNQNSSKRIAINFYANVNVTKVTDVDNIFAYMIDGAANAGCRWICKPGYSGKGCNSQPTRGSCGKDNMTELSSISGYKFTNRISEPIDVLAKSEHTKNSDDRNASVTVLAIIAYYQHGVLVSRVKIDGKRNFACNGTCIKSWVTNVAAVGQKYLLCDDGYKPNSSNTDCVCDNEPTTAEKLANLCSGFTETNYDSSLHKLVAKDNCYIYECTNERYGFAGVDDFSCVSCPTTSRSGVGYNGVCLKCPTSQYFDKKNSTCKETYKFSRTDLQYGGKGKNQLVNNQCWVKYGPTDYRKCINDSFSGVEIKDDTTRNPATSSNSVSEGYQVVPNVQINIDPTMKKVVSSDYLLQGYAVP